MISIICPIYNEETVLSKNSVTFQKLSCQAELIFVDGLSIDRSTDIARPYGRVLKSKKGRAIQMNVGAQAALGDILVFLHADTTISTDSLPAIEEKITKDGYVGGCFTQRITKAAPIFRLIEAQGNIRARWSKVFYGDQGIFVKKDIFFKIGGFPEVPIMEDVLFTRKLRQAGKTTVLPDTILVSPRRWEKHGIIKTTLLYNLIIILFRLGFPLDKIRLLYEDLR